MDPAGEPQVALALHHYVPGAVVALDGEAAEVLVLCRGALAEQASWPAQGPGGRGRMQVEAWKYVR